MYMLTNLVSRGIPSKKGCNQWHHTTFVLLLDHRQGWLTYLITTIMPKNDLFQVHASMIALVPFVLDYYF